MTNPTPLEKAVNIVGLCKLSALCGVRYQSFNKWLKQGRFPYTELAGVTHYAAAIEQATGGQVTQEELFDWSFPHRLNKPCCNGNIAQGYVKSIAAERGVGANAG